MTHEENHSDAPTQPIRLGVLISGGGTTLQNFVDRIAAGTLTAEIPLVIASQSECRGIERARNAGLRCEVITRKSYDSTEAFSNVIFDLCREAKVELVTLAGYLSLIRIPDDFTHRVMNIHPALIPSFCGKGYFGHHVHEAVLDRGARVSGCTVHFADNEYDHGPIIIQKCVPVLDDDTPDSLAARVFEQERDAYSEAIELFAQKRLTIAGRRVQIAQS
jgi:phosphoribosylglycinamide formyltransferase 1